MDDAPLHTLAAEAILGSMVTPVLFTHAETARLRTDRQLRREAGRGEFVRVTTGVYTSAIGWNGLDADERYRVFVRAQAMRSAAGAQFSHDSAAALWRLPGIGPWPTVAHELVDTHFGGTSRRAIRRHGRGRDAEPYVIDGVTVTSLTRTLVDVACSSPMVRSVAMLDSAQRAPDQREPRWGFPYVTKDRVLDELDALGEYYGSVRARRAILFSTPLSGSPGESFARVQFAALGLAPPELQVEFVDEDGSIGFTDFYWPGIDLIGEFDGRSKYGDRRMFQTDLTAHEILLREKDREDRLRRVSRGFVRLSWKLVSDRRALALEMQRHGLIRRRTTANDPFPDR